MMTKDRLLVSYIINVYYKLGILDQIAYIIDIFANFKNRRLVFVL
jgi:hypothetical protein